MELLQILIANSTTPIEASGPQVGRFIYSVVEHSDFYYGI